MCHDHVREQAPGAFGVEADVESAVAGEPEDGGGVDEAEEHDGGCVGRHVRPQGAVLLAFPDELRHFAEVVLNDAMDALPAAGVGVEDFFREHDAGDGHVVLEQVDVKTEQATQTARSGGFLLAHGVDVFLQSAGDKVEHRVQHRILAGVVAVDGGGHDANLVGQRGEIERLGTVARHQFQRGGGNLLLPDLGLCFSGAHIVNICSQYKHRAADEY